jgi:hypothetical protein
LCWRVGSLLRQRQRATQAFSVVGSSMSRPLSVSCVEYLLERHSSVAKDRIPPCAARPLGMRCRVDLEVRYVYHVSCTTLCSIRWPMLLCAVSWIWNIVRARGPQPLSCPNASVLRFVRTTSAGVVIRSSWPCSCAYGVRWECYLVDPASSHMLVSKIKPCMCKYELIQTVKLRMAH